jgi:hypothetical protein
MPKTTCPYCSLGCEIALRYDPFGSFTYDFDREFKLCAKGIGLLDILNSKKRVLHPFAGGELSTVQDIALKIKGLKDAQVFVSPFSTLEAGRYASALAESLGAEKVGVVGIEGDYELLDGALSPGLSDSSELEGGETFFLFGDVFNMAPPLATPVLNARYNDKKRVVSLKPVSSTTAAFAHAVIEVPPADVLVLLKEVLKGLNPGAKVSAFKGDPSPSVMASAEVLVKELKSAKNPVFLYGTFLGQVPDLYLYSLFIDSIADCVKAKVFRVLSGGNTYGFYRRRGRFVPAGTLSGGSAVCIDCHDDGLYPGRKWKERVLLTSFSPDKALVIPKAIAVEEGGTYETGSGRTMVVEAIDPASGALTLDKLVELTGITASGEISSEDISSEIDVSKAEARFADSMKWREDMKVGPDEILLLFDNSHRFYLQEELNENSGYISSRANAPQILLSPEWARKLGIQDGEKVQASTRAGEAEFEVEISEGMGGSVGTVRRVSGLSVFERLYGVPVPTRAKIKKASNG